MRTFLTPLVKGLPDTLVLRNQRTGAVVASQLLPAFDSETRRTGLLKHTGLTDAEWNAFAPFVLEREISAVSLECLLRAAEWFHTRIPLRLRNDARFAEAAPHEATAAYLRVRPKAREVLDDLRALSSWRERASLVREHLFPPADYMTRVYAPESRLPLPLLYAERLLRGASGWLRKRE